MRGLFVRGGYSGPVLGVNAPADKVVETRIRPLGDGFYIAVLNGIPVNIINMFFKISFIANLMFPKATLPESKFVAFKA